MSRITSLLLLFCLALAVDQASADDLPLTGIGQGGISKYAGPGDIVAYSFWCGLRAYSAAVAATGTQKSLNIRRASDNTTADILILTSGAFDTATANTFCNATSCFVHTCYNQPGGVGDMVMTTNANQPQLVFNCIGTFPCMSSLSSASVNLAVSGNITPATGLVSLSIFAWAARTSSAQTMLEENGANLIGVANSANSWRLSGASGAFSAAATDSVWHAGNAVINGSGSHLNIDGTDTDGVVTGSTAAGPAESLIGSTVVATKATEVGWSDNVGFTAGQRVALAANQGGYW